MLAHELMAAIAAASTIDSVNAVARCIWQENGQGRLADDAAQALAESAQARKGELRERMERGAPRPRPLPRRRDHGERIERRRRQAASGAVPSWIAAKFTGGEVAALTVIVRTVQKAGCCALPINAIAALAGVCRSIVQTATREARRLGLLRVTERRIPGRKSLTNLIEVVSPDWSIWLRLRKAGAIGCRKSGAMITSIGKKVFEAGRNLVANEEKRPPKGVSEDRRRELRQDEAAVPG